MKCPKCNLPLLMSEKQGIEIDYCPECRGIWLDRGELDKIIERTNSTEPERGLPYQGNSIDYQRHDKHYDEHHGYKYGRKKSLLSELFD